MTRWRTRHRGSASDRGAAAVEFAIVFVILIFIIFSIIDFGRLLFAVQSMKAASREGARTAVVASGTGATVLAAAQNSGSTAAALAGGSLVVSYATSAAPTTFTTVSNSSPTLHSGFCPGSVADESVSIKSFTTFRWFTPTMPFLGIFLGPANVPSVEATTTMRCE